MVKLRVSSKMILCEACKSPTDGAQINPGSTNGAGPKFCKMCVRRHQGVNTHLSPLARNSSFENWYDSMFREEHKGVQQAHLAATVAKTVEDFNSPSENVDSPHQTVIKECENVKRLLGPDLEEQETIFVGSFQTKNQGVGVPDHPGPTCSHCGKGPLPEDVQQARFKGQHFLFCSPTCYDGWLRDSCSTVSQGVTQQASAPEKHDVDTSISGVNAKGKDTPIIWEPKVRIAEANELLQEAAQKGHDENGEQGCPDVSAAEAKLRENIKRFPTHIASHTFLASLLALRGSFDEAEILSAEALRLQQDRDHQQENEFDEPNETNINCDDETFVNENLSQPSKLPVSSALHAEGGAEPRLTVDDSETSDTSVSVRRESRASELQQERVRAETVLQYMQEVLDLADGAETVEDAVPEPS